MRKQHRWYLLFALVLALSAVAAGCGGDDEEGAGGTETGAQGVSGSVTILAVWTGAEGEAFQAVLDGFTEQNPDVNVNYQSAQDPATVLSTAVEGGNPPDLAALSSPGIMRDFQSRGALKPIDFAQDVVSENFSQDWIDLATIDGALYGVFFKGGNKSTVWYNVQAFEDAGITEPPADWDAFLEAGQTLKASGVTAYSIGASDGWTLTDWFENVYLRVAGPEKYDQLTNHEIPWTDQSVKDSLTELAKVFSDTGNIAGGTSGALQTDFPTSISQIYADPPKAAIAYEGDFAAGVITSETQAQPQTDFDFFDFPSINDSPPSVVGGGDVVVMFTDSPAAQALVTYLASPEAAEIWAQRGGFSSPNKNVDESVYPDDITRRAATALANAESFRFDLSDLAPTAFGSDAMFSLLQEWFRNPSDVDGITAKLEAAAKTAYGS